MAPSVPDIVPPVTDTIADLKLAATKEDKFPPTQVYEHTDPGAKADRAKPHLLTPETNVTHLSPFLGTEISGALNELAAERKVLIFCNQDFKDIGPDRQIAIAKHFGRIQRHPTSGDVKGYPEFHVVYRDTEHDRLKEIISDERINRTQWHSDVSYEKQPAGTTFFFILDRPEVGADTLFASQVEAYNRLSPEFKKRLEGLRAVHSAVEQAESSRRRGGVVRREPVLTEHPVVRRHPVTGEKALYTEESEYLLKFLFDHIAKGADFQIRARYEPGSVVVWDNRVTAHSATGDFNPGERRHAVRLTPEAKVPTEV
ncbi:alpha-ketoglutarate catabolism dioxygenase [Suillus decipiens]|nr:alpha-ketoglutarate catabolism dioxygenase [Suillus decipiens]